MRRGNRFFSRVSTGHSDIPSSCEMKDEPAFKPVQGNPAFFLVRASRYPLHLRQQTQGPSHIPITERRLLLRCLWKVGLPLQRNPGNQLSSRDSMVCMKLSSSSCAEIGVPIDLRRVSQGISGVAQRKSSHLSCMTGTGDCCKPLHGNQSSFRVDLGYTELFNNPAVTSVSF